MASLIENDWHLEKSSKVARPSVPSLGEDRDSPRSTLRAALPQIPLNLFQVPAFLLMTMAVPDDDDELPVREARAGSSEAWEVLFRRFQRPLYAYVFGILHDEQSSLDVVQETFLNAIRHLGRLRDDRKLGSWLFGIAHQKCLQACRRTGRDERLQEALSESAADLEEAPDLRLLREEDASTFLAAVDSLPAPQRSVLLLHYLEEFPLEVIAGITDVPVGTVKSRLHHARRSLHRILHHPPAYSSVVGHSLPFPS